MRVVRRIFPSVCACACGSTESEPAGNSRTGYIAYRRCIACGKTVGLPPIGFEVLDDGAKRSRITLSVD